jgi:hypothetical protein
MVTKLAICHIVVFIQMKQKDAVEMENASIKVAAVRMDSMVNTVAKNIAQKIAVDVVNAVTTEFVNAILDLAAKHVMNNIVCQ